MSDVIHVACTTTGAYAAHTGTMLHSLLWHNRAARWHVHVLHSELGGDDAKRLRQIAGRFGAALDFLPIDADDIAGLPTGRFHKACWYRILLPALRPELPRMLYLDSDLVVCGEMATLWRTDLEGRLFAAVTNPLYPFMPDFPRTTLGIDDRARYVNSGVLLMDLAQMRAVDFVGAVRAYASRHPDNLYPEQDALSALYHDRCLLLHPRWNAQSTLWDLAAQQLPFDATAVAEARREPRVVHFIGPYKPWSYLCRHPLRERYFVHRRQVPWPSQPLEGRTWRTMLLRPLPVAWHDRWYRAERRLRRAVRRLRGAEGPDLR